jgi:heme A synthase
VVVALCVVAAAALLAALRRRPRRPDLTWLSAGLIGGILAEAVIGGIVVYSKLNPYVVMTHFMVGHRSAHRGRPPRPPGRTGPRVTGCRLAG